jgi:hypothetical protein
MYNPLYLRDGTSNASQGTSVSLRGMLGHVPWTRDRRASDDTDDIMTPPPMTSWPS